MKSTGSWAIRPAVILLTGLLLAAASGCRRSPCEGCNLVLVVVDTLRADHCSPYGYSRDTTPNLTRLAAEGVLFEHVTSQASFTMASMGTLFTATYPHHHGAGRHPSILGEKNFTLAERLRDAGYATGAVVCNPLLGPGSGFEQGFDTYRHVEEKEVRGARGIVEQGITWMETHREGPFFLWLHILDPHFPYLTRPGYTLVKDEKAHEEYEDLLKRKRSGDITMGEIFFERQLSPAAMKEAVAAYDGEISYTDKQFGLLLEALKRLGLKDNTLVVFTSDHGESLGEHGLYFSHGFSVYEEALKVPLVMGLPGFEGSGKRVREPVALLDLMPCLLDLLGVKSPPNPSGRNRMTLFEGTDLKPSIEGDGPVFSESEPMYVDGGKRRYPQRKEIYLEGDEGKWRSLFLWPDKLIAVPRPEGPELSLFDLRRDPRETTNVSARKPEEAADLLGKIRTWRSEPGVRESVSLPELDAEWAKRLQSIGYTK